MFCVNFIHLPTAAFSIAGCPLYHVALVDVRLVPVTYRRLDFPRRSCILHRAVSAIRGDVLSSYCCSHGTPTSIADRRKIPRSTMVEQVRDNGKKRKASIGADNRSHGWPKKGTLRHAGRHLQPEKKTVVWATPCNLQRNVFTVF